MAILTRWRFRFVGGLIGLAVAALVAAQPPAGLSEQELRAAALNQIVHFARWPAEVLGNDDRPLVIGVFGEDPFGPLLQDLVMGERASGHPVEVRHCFNPEEAGNCHVLFISGADRRAADHLVHLLENKSVLTVTDSEALTDEGAVIGLTVRNHRIHLLVNLEAARRANLTLSSKLLRLAEIVRK